MTQISSNYLFGLAFAFFLTFRVAYNIPDHAVVLLLWFFKHLETIKCPFVEFSDHLRYVLIISDMF